MTSVEMHYNLQTKLKALGYPSERLDSYFVEQLLNEALFVFIDRYLPLLKSNEIARKKLHPLIQNAELTPAAHSTSNISTYGVTVTLPVDYYKTLNEYITTTTGVVDVKPIDYDEYNLNRNNPFRKPYSDLVWRLELNVSGREHELIPSSDVSIVKYRLRYIKTPDAIDINNDTTTDLRPEDHDEVVNLAIGLLSGGKRNQEDKNSNEKVDKN